MSPHRRGQLIRTLNSLYARQVEAVLLIVECPTSSSHARSAVQSFAIGNERRVRTLVDRVVSLLDQER